MQTKTTIQVLISAPEKDEAEKIADTLLEKKLIAGSMITEGQTRYWWKGEVVARQDWNINAFSVKDHQDTIKSIVKKHTSDETPIIAFFAMDGSEDFLKWVREWTNNAST